MKHDLSLPKARVSYAQNREDYVLAAIFLGQKKGFYIDVGAFHPTKDSVTKLFYDQGWNGINIDANPVVIDDFAKLRKRDINLSVGVSNKKQELSFYHFDQNGLSTFSKKMAEEVKKKLNKNYSTQWIKVDTLKSILDKNVPKNTTIDFLKVDVEGLEYEVLSSNDWATYKPKVICIEANHVLHDWHGLLEEQGYRQIFNDGLNQYFSKENIEVMENFVSLFLETEPPIVSNYYFEQLERYKDYVGSIISLLEKNYQDNLKYSKELEAQIDEKNRELKRLQQELRRMRSFVFWSYMKVRPVLRAVKRGGKPS